MITSIGQVMLYVNDTEAARDFWCQKMGFVEIDKLPMMATTSYVIAPQLSSDVQFVLHNKEVIKQLSPEVSLEIPSILLATDDIHATYQQLVNQEVVVNEIQQMPEFLVCNFADNEGNYYAIKQTITTD